jgi:hypothetical protein
MENPGSGIIHSKIVKIPEKIQRFVINYVEVLLTRNGSMIGNAEVQR